MAGKIIAQKWFNAFNAHDLEALLSLYHDKAKHYSPKLKARKPETNGMVVGKDALRAWWKDSFDRLPTLSYHPVFILNDDNKVFMEYLRKVEGEEDLTVGELLVIEDGLIVESKVYHG